MRAEFKIPLANFGDEFFEAKGGTGSDKDLHIVVFVTLLTQSSLDRIQEHELSMSGHVKAVRVQVL